MKSFQTVAWDRQQCRKELDELRKLLRRPGPLKEREDLLRFFRRRLQLSAFLGCYHPKAVRFDLVAHEYDLFGDFACDLAVGDSERKVYGFIEFEDAAAGSIFVKRRGKSSLEWAPRFEHGFSQLVDWFCKLADMEKTDEFEDRFGKRSIECFGLLVVGKDESLGEKELRRLQWRQDKVLIDSHKVHCLTFNQLYEDLNLRLSQYGI
jgi:hypothetical protein